MDSSEDKKTFWQQATNVIKHIPGAALVFAIVPLLVIGYAGWYYYAAEHLDKALYSLRLENLEVSSQPEWIEGNLAQDVFQASGLDQISLLDQNATAAIAQAFESNVWVKSVPSVTKAAGGKVQANLHFRKPLAMVALYGAPEPEGANSIQAPKLVGKVEIQGFLCVDEEAVLLPGFGEEDLDDFIIVDVLGAAPPSRLVGAKFGDPRVSQALSLCKLLAPLRSELGIRMLTVSEDYSARSLEPWNLNLFTQDDLQVVWGRAPNKETVGEPDAATKLGKLIAWLKDQRRKAADPQLQNSLSKQIDLRSNQENSRPVSTSSSRP
ncbi:MAG: cell division protein FtsQ/DivIB [Pirellulaceae bacterium]